MVNPPISAESVVVVPEGIAVTPSAWGGCLKDPNVALSDIFIVGIGNPNAS